MPFDIDTLILDRLGERTITFCGHKTTMRPLRQRDHDEIWRLRSDPKLVSPRDDKGRPAPPPAHVVAQQERRAHERTLLMVAVAIDMRVRGLAYQAKPTSDAAKADNMAWAAAVLASLEEVPVREINTVIAELAAPVSLEADAGKSSLTGAEPPEPGRSPSSANTTP